MTPILFLIAAAAPLECELAAERMTAATERVAVAEGRALKTGSERDAVIAALAADLAQEQDGTCAMVLALSQDVIDAMARRLARRN